MSLDCLVSWSATGWSKIKLYKKIHSKQKGLVVCRSEAFVCIHVEPRRKYKSTDFKSAIVAAHQYRKGYFTISKQAEVPKSGCPSKAGRACSGKQQNKYEFYVSDCAGLMVYVRCLAIMHRTIVIFQQLLDQSTSNRSTATETSDWDVERHLSGGKQLVREVERYINTWLAPRNLLEVSWARFCLSLELLLVIGSRLW